MERETFGPDPSARYTGYHLGIRRKLAVSLDDAWNYVCGAKALQIWIVEPGGLMASSEGDVSMPDGTEICWKGMNKPDILNFAYKLPGWSSFSNVCIRLIPHEDLVVLQVIQENIPDLDTRKYLAERLDKLLNQDQF